MHPLDITGAGVYCAKSLLGAIVTWFRFRVDEPNHSGSPNHCMRTPKRNEYQFTMARSRRDEMHTERTKRELTDFAEGCAPLKLSLSSSSRMGMERQIPFTSVRTQFRRTRSAPEQRPEKDDHKQGAHCPGVKSGKEAPQQQECVVQKKTTQHR
ncbi:hypothetical protein U9M48_015437 [Paspalum notatum var. saurae]|uniref:Uncharacterized protein n=1 Tax=Paspalum notatum var. saurae TaxID=547442 RepID=A0AAQ3WLV2_PASNO